MKILENLEKFDKINIKKILKEFQNIKYVNFWILKRKWGGGGGEWLTSLK